MRTAYFLEMIKGLRENEEIILYANRPEFSENERIKVINFLRKEYDREALNFPFEAPIFNEGAAIWSAEFVYLVAQFILYRKDNIGKLDELFPIYLQEVDASTALSVDLTFRFIPDMLLQLRSIDSEDPLINLVEDQLHKWHYSGIKYDLDVHNIEMNWIFSSRCMQQLYVDRIIAYKNIKLAKNKNIYPHLKATLSIFETFFWVDFNLINVHE